RSLHDALPIWVRSLDWLLRDGERDRYRDLSPEERESYEQTVWTLSDPLYLTPANELWLEHVARYTYSRLMERVRVVRDMVSWRRDNRKSTRLNSSHVKISYAV